MRFGSEAEMARSRRGLSLVEILVVVCIMVVLGALLMQRLLGSGKKDALGQNKLTSPMQKARGTECVNNVTQLRQGYQTALIGADDENKPQTIADISRGFPASMLNCPESKQPYQFDPATGRVSCVTHPRN
jgi:hypothetical protein